MLCTTQITVVSPNNGHHGTQVFVLYSGYNVCHLLGRYGYNKQPPTQSNSVIDIVVITD